MDIAAKRAAIAQRLDRARDDSQRFVTRLEKYLHEVGATSDKPGPRK